MAYETIIYEKKGKIAYVTLNRPEALNATNAAMHNELYDAWQDVIKDDDIWVVILTGAGRAFQTGADMKEAASGSRAREHMGWPSTLETDLGLPGDPGARGATRVTKPIILAINGMIGGGGLQFLYNCDIIIASDKAQILDFHSSRGWQPVPESGMHMPRAIAMRMAIMGLKDRISAQRAYELGLVTEVVPHDKLIERATEIAEAICTQSPIAVRGAKAAIAKVYASAYTRVPAITRYYYSEVNSTDDHREGPRAFAQKRDPVWSGKYPNVRV